MKGIPLALLGGAAFWAWLGSIGLVPWPLDHFCGFIAAPLAVMFGGCVVLAINEETPEP